MKLDSVPPNLSASESATPNADLSPQLEIKLTTNPEIALKLTPEPVDCSMSSTSDLCPEPKGLTQKHWAIFASTFVTIFLAEIGDKTQIAVLLMTAESHNPWIVFAGAGSALVATSLLGVLLGRWLASRIDARTLERLAGGILLGISAILLWEVIS
ncbi:MAG: TMEM165/GDT1 family protein [Oscillatoriales cyanobacterium]|uniref:GDT1 family protein n=1 Tax=Microcoleus anatoxicus PTRS2 TaxID=2705321 RepID=A0ABU8YH51_9CYAN|nr:MAG: TMEM165/GDT1 family protein [Oscillatoriales cyanobacterium]TAE01770.1 MAG: TMEM165/GDT1 family protein [Oscillatoriales cyanobacterium]TAF06774.1 MAG: TMEM165/GDT1 family protein [Oscillatoriales cyanobacterium]TAF47337.1 MAG: TMEM165/GDT1 family protein [Oscillatoriales cyanobacterium]TAF64357.1 MAG: TMEM165/GDT1 family protein [Oscillatoriales cyanobacterium]